MKTYTAFSGFVALLAMACTSTIDEPNENVDPPIIDNGVEADYTMVLENNAVFSSEELHTDLTKVRRNGVNSISSVSPVQLTYKEASSMTFYQKNEDCSHEIALYDFDLNRPEAMEVLSDKNDCELNVNAIAHTGNTTFIGYTLPDQDTLEEHFFVREQQFGENIFTDIPLTGKPLSIVFSKNRLFVFSVNEDTTDHVLMVVNLDNESIEKTINLGQGALQQFLNKEDHIIVAYEELHLSINPQTLETESQVRYNEDVAPNFAKTASIFFDEDGNLYFQRISETGIPEIPALYNFGTNTTTLYFYENFLTAEQLQTKFKIGTTTMVAYDDKNDLLLIGYRKSDNANKGGLIRIAPSREIAFLDNTDFDGVPYHIYIK